jgi:nitrile hydratase subunit beta
MITAMRIVDHNPAKFKVGDRVLVAARYPIGHYRVPTYLRGKMMTIIRLLGTYINPEEEAFGKNAGNKLWFYRLSMAQQELWPDYEGSPQDKLEIEIFENWLEKI